MLCKAETRCFNLNSTAWGFASGSSQRATVNDAKHDKVSVFAAFSISDPLNFPACESQDLENVRSVRLKRLCVLDARKRKGRKVISCHKQWVRSHEIRDFYELFKNVRSEENVGQSQEMWNNLSVWQCVPQAKIAIFVPSPRFVPKVRDQNV